VREKKKVWIREREREIKVRPMNQDLRESLLRSNQSAQPRAKFFRRKKKSRTRRKERRKERDNDFGDEVWS